MAVILGIDPGSRIAGYGVILSDGFEISHIDHGVIRFSEKKSLPERLFDMRRALDQLIKQYQPTEIVVEGMFLGKNPQSAFVLGHVRGVCLERGVAHGLGIFEYAARTIKKSLTGNGNAAKDQVRSMVLHYLNVSTELPLDATDALAVALTHGRHVSRTTEARI
ncbi:MAG: crossover junction endodeoxyribonuclease RuvC [Bdellovibrionales bacterium]